MTEHQSRPPVIIVGTETRRLMELAIAFRGMSREITIAEARRPIVTARRMMGERPAAMVVDLVGTENVMDIRGVLEAGHGVPVIFLTPRMPPRAAIARIAHASGAEIMGADQPPIVILATLVAMLSTAGEAAHNRRSTQ